jgi:5-bromo-4-chloroindolyl phosphate hydrolysis protein
MIYNDEERQHQKKEIALKAYLKRIGKTTTDYDVWRAKINLKKKKAEMRKMVTEYVKNADLESLERLSELLESTPPLITI